jgi:hypothetical protein
MMQTVVSSQSDVQNKADILHGRAGQVFENRDKVQKFVIVGIGKPTADRHRMLGMEHIRRGRVVDNDSLPKISADLRKILHVVALVVVATLAE